MFECVNAPGLRIDVIRRAAVKVADNRVCSSHWAYQGDNGRFHAASRISQISTSDSASKSTAYHQACAFFGLIWYASARACSNSRSVGRCVVSTGGFDGFFGGTNQTIRSSVSFAQ